MIVSQIGVFYLHNEFFLPSLPIFLLSIPMLPHCESIVIPGTSNTSVYWLG